MFNRRNTQPAETYPLMEALAVAVAVDRAQGFVKSKQGFFDEETKTYTADNRNTAARSLRVMAGKEEEFPEQDPEHMRYSTLSRVFRPTDEDYQEAQAIFSYFDEILVMDKLGDDLVKVGKDGRQNDFNLVLSEMFERGTVGINKDLAMLVSLPNSRRIGQRREEMEEFHRNNSENGYIGELRKRMKLSGRVMDIKYIPSAQIHLATVFTTENKIAKFFMNDRLSEMVKNLDGQDITFTGTVKKQEVNNFTGCQETMFNRVKIE